MFNREKLDNKISELTKKLEGFPHEFIEYPSPDEEYSSKGFIMGIVSHNGVVMFSNSSENGTFKFYTFDARLDKNLKKAGCSKEEVANSSPMWKITEKQAIKILKGENV